MKHIWNPTVHRSFGLMWNFQCCLWKPIKQHYKPEGILYSHWLVKHLVTLRFHVLDDNYTIITNYNWTMLDFDRVVMLNVWLICRSKFCWSSVNWALWEPKRVPRPQIFEIFCFYIEIFQPKVTVSLPQPFWSGHGGWLPWRPSSVLVTNVSQQTFFGRFVLVLGSEALILSQRMCMHLAILPSLF